MSLTHQLLLGIVRSFFGSVPGSGSLFSWPFFALSHHFLVWLAADLLYPGRVFTRYALLGDDIVIGDPKVASVYRDMMTELGVFISLFKEILSNREPIWRGFF